MYKKELKKLYVNFKEIKKLRKYRDIVAVNSTTQTALLLIIAKILDEKYPK